MKRLICLFGALALVACGDSTGTVAQFNGTYDLTTVNGAPLPFVLFQDASGKDEIVSDTFVAANGSFTQHTVERFTPTGGTAQTSAFDDSGTYTIDGNRVTIFFDSGGSVTGTISGDKVTINNGAAIVYVRR